MPKMSGQSVKAYPSERIDDYWLRLDIYYSGVPEEEIVSKLRKFGLGAYEVELLMMRIVEGMTMQDIVTEQGWVNAYSASYYLRRAIKKLRAARFSFR